MKPDKIIPSLVRGFKLPELEFEYDEYKTILYALGIGLSQDPLNTSDLNFTYESSPDFKVLPTFGTSIDRIEPLAEALKACEGLPDFDLNQILHGEHKLQCLHPFPKKQKLKIVSEFTDVADKVKGALLTLTTTVLDESNSIICISTRKSFIRGLGGFGDKGLKNDVMLALPQSQPHKVSIQSTSANQSLLFRLSGDYSELHVSPQVASAFGFPRPILHGLCSFGIAARAVLKEVCEDDVRRFKSIFARFVSHVFPGETLVTEIWQNENFIVFVQKTQERGNVCSQGFVEVGV